MQDVNKHNAEAFRVAIAELTTKVLAQGARIDQQNEKISTLHSQVVALTSDLNMMRARTAGSGATVR